MSPAAPRGNAMAEVSDNQYGLPTAPWEQSDPYSGGQGHAFGLSDPAAAAVDQATAFRPGHMSASIGQSTPQALASALSMGHTLDPALGAMGSREGALPAAAATTNTAVSTPLDTTMGHGANVPATSPAVATGHGSTTAGTTTPTPAGAIPPRPQFFSPMTAEERAIVDDWDRKYGRKPL
jgi:hypothetical protein